MSDFEYPIFVVVICRQVLCKKSKTIIQNSISYQNISTFPVKIYCISFPFHCWLIYFYQKYHYSCLVIFRNPKLWKCTLLSRRRIRQQGGQPKGSFNNYEDQIIPNFNPLPPPRLGKNGHFTHLPPSSCTCSYWMPPKVWWRSIIPKLNQVWKTRQKIVTTHWQIKQSAYP